MHPNVAKWIDLDKKLNETAPQKSEAWLKLRHGMLTASDAATALGCNKYETPFKLLLKKCGLGEKFEGNEATRHGEKYEAEARIKFEAKFPELGKVWEFGVCPHPVHKFLGGSPDGVTEISNSLVEIKCPMMRDIGEGAVPEHYMPQLQLCMDILDLEGAYFVQYKPALFNWPNPEEFVVTRVERDREWMVHSLPIFRKFWDDVEYYRQHLDELRAKIPAKRTRAKKIKPPAECAFVEADSEDEWFSD